VTNLSDTTLKPNDLKPLGHIFNLATFRIRLSEKTHAMAKAIACDAVRNSRKPFGSHQAHRQSPVPSSLLASAFN
jgi:hypothetical protein